MLHIAVLGAGSVGCGVALEVGGRGHTVDLFDQEAAPIQRASWANEGKIHQGFIYANETSRATSRLMAKGAATFQPILSRWIDIDWERTISTPFVYMAHRETLVDVDRLRAHYADVVQIANDYLDASGGEYLLPGRRAYCNELDLHSLDETFSTENFVAAFQTGELAVDTRVVALALREAVEQSSNVKFFGRSRVKSVQEQRSHYMTKAGLLIES